MLFNCTSSICNPVQELFSALSNGEVRKLSMVDLVNPFSAAWKNYRRAKKTITDHNMKVRSSLPSSAASGWRLRHAAVQMVFCLR